MAEAERILEGLLSIEGGATMEDISTDPDLAAVHSGAWFQQRSSSSIGDI